MRCRAAGDTDHRTSVYDGRGVWDTTKPAERACRLIDETRARRPFRFEPTKTRDDGVEEDLAPHLASRATVDGQSPEHRNPSPYLWQVSDGSSPGDAVRGAVK